MKHLPLLQRIILTSNAISTKLKKHFHGISMITMQFPSKENQGVKQIVIHDLSLFDKNQKKSEKIRLTSVYNQHRIFKLSGHIT